MEAGGPGRFESPWPGSAENPGAPSLGTARPGHRERGRTLHKLSSGSQGVEAAGGPWGAGPQADESLLSLSQAPLLKGSSVSTSVFLLLFFPPLSVLLPLKINK